MTEILKFFKENNDLLDRLGEDNPSITQNYIFKGKDVLVGESEKGKNIDGMLVDYIEELESFYNCFSKELNLEYIKFVEGIKKVKR